MNRQRAVRQKLEDLRRAGVTHLPVELAREMAQILKHSSSTSAPQRNAESPQPAVSSRPVAPTPEMKTPKPTESPNLITAALKPSTIAASVTSPVASTPTDAPIPTVRACSALTREQRIAQLSDVSARVAQCMRCGELARLRTQTVFGIGNPEAQIMFIGEAPGADEDQQGEPFVGESGQLLNKIITAAKLTREEIYICNILRCRPPGNRTPAPQEAENCREFLDAQIGLVNPEYIVCWGAVAAQNLLRSSLSIGRMRGRFFDYQGIKVLCTYHPSYLLRNASAKKDVWEDIKFFRRSQGVVLD